MSFHFHANDTQLYISFESSILGDALHWKSALMVLVWRILHGCMEM